MSTELHLAALNRDAEVLKSQIVLGEALNRLKNNRDFKNLIIEGFMKDEAVRLVHLKADPSMQTAASQTAIMRDIDAIGSLNQYLTVVSQKGIIASKGLADVELAREELLQGDE